MKRFALFFLLVFLPGMGFSQTDTLQGKIKEKKKTGWTWAALPILAFDADQGVQFGALGQIFDYGDGSKYPEYRSTFYGECSWFTRGSATYQIFYDSKYLVPGGIRVTLDLDYLPERALDFYGFNGYRANFNPGFSTEGSPEYISRMFYRYERNMFRIMADFQGPLFSQKVRWLAGLNLIGMKAKTVDIERFNKGKDESHQLPDTALLYDRYVQYGLIGEDEKEGGTHAIMKTGIVMDTRNNEAAPDRGIWSEIMLMTSPGLAASSKTFVRLAVTHRQYVSLFPEHLVFAYQVGYQGTVAGSTPFYLLPYIFTSYSLTTRPDGLGGSKNLRGVLRDRVVGEGVALGNAELRWKIFRRVIFGQNVYFGLTGFADAGMVVQERKTEPGLIPVNERNLYFRESSDRVHVTAGVGFRIGLNENFIVAFDFGKAFNPQDGTSGIYIGVGNIF